MFNKSLILGGVAVALMTMPAVAQAETYVEIYKVAAARDAGELEFQKLDANKDGQVSQNEFLSHTYSNLVEFDLIDTNRDDKLTENEIAYYNSVGADNKGSSKTNTIVQ